MPVVTNGQVVPEMVLGMEATVPAELPVVVVGHRCSKARPMTVGVPPLMLAFSEGFSPRKSSTFEEKRSDPSSSPSSGS